MTDDLLNLDEDEDEDFPPLVLLDEPPRMPFAGCLLVLALSVALIVAMAFVVRGW